MSNSKRVIPVILCGGAGTRLWPLSRKNFPKPFLKVGSESLIAQTVRRAAALIKGTAAQDILLVSNESYQFLLQDECLPVLQSEGGGIALHQLLEPQGRNTAPAIALAAQWAQARYPNENPVLLVLPADHLINPVDEFVRVAQQALAAAKAGWLCCFGIAPTAPETGFGYIQQGAPVNELQAVYAVQRFVEKPKLELAMEYLASGQYVWNGGMFAFGAQQLLAAMQQHQPDVAQQAEVVMQGSKAATNTKSKGEVVTFNKDAFAQLPDISIDYAVMEKASNVAVVSAKFAWSDIGSWAALAEQCQPDAQGNTVQAEGQGELINIGSSNTHVRLGNRAVATLGVSNLLVIDTPDALLVADRSRHQEVKQVVDVLKAKGSELTNFHPTVHRPWGTYTVLEDSAGYKIKRIEVKPGAALSLQMHHHRSEHWIVVSGTARVTNGEEVFLVRKNESTYIPAGNKHRLENPGVMNLVMIEVQSGDYLEEDDIVRFDDVYGRA
ncbi:mannose-1-phosphate guanylyltransferase/mannose-6-phosphate isomerase [Limnobacter sp.]|uniref:mannose-1-phosphate guanylyltransferase/mannose-6-phosphate isomerase n=1 Tax=Limnobacter sp. TaxID=2003368 RepID=UPI003512DB8F